MAVLSEARLNPFQYQKQDWQFVREGLQQIHPNSNRTNTMTPREQVR